MADTIKVRALVKVKGGREEELYTEIPASLSGHLRLAIDSLERYKEAVKYGARQPMRELLNRGFAAIWHRLAGRFGINSDFITADLEIRHLEDTRAVEESMKRHPSVVPALVLAQNPQGQLF